MSRLRMFAAFATVAVSASLLQGAPVGATWTESQTRTVSGMQMAHMGHWFDPIRSGVLLGTASGTGGAAYTSQWGGIGVSTYFDITSLSSVPVSMSGAIGVERGPGVTLFPQITVVRCSVPWNAALGTCLGTPTVVAGPVATANTGTLDLGVVEVGQAAHIAVFTGVGVGSMRISTTATSSPTRTGMDRSHQ